MARQKPRRPSAASRDQRRVAKTPPKSSSGSPRWLKYVGGAAALVVIVAIAATAGGSDSNGGAEPVVRDPEIVAAGAQLYSANCATCHGVELGGTDTGPPFLNAIYAPNHHADEAFQRAVAGGVTPHHWNFGPMAPIDGLSRAEVATIAQFIRSEQEAAGIFRDPSHG